MQTPFDYASDVCRRFKANVSKLSGVGMQLAGTQGKWGQRTGNVLLIVGQKGKERFLFFMMQGKQRDKGRAMFRY